MNDEIRLINRDALWNMLPESNAKEWNRLMHAAHQWKKQTKENIYTTIHVIENPKRSIKNYIVSFYVRKQKGKHRMSTQKPK